MLQNLPTMLLHLNPPTGLLNPPTVLLNLPTMLLNPPTVLLNPPTMLLVAPSSQLRQVITAVELLTPTSITTIITALTRSQSTAERKLSFSRASSWMITIRSRGTLRASCLWSPTLGENPPLAALDSGSQGREAAETWTLTVMPRILYSSSLRLRRRIMRSS